MAVVSFGIVVGFLYHFAVEVRGRARVTNPFALYSSVLLIGPAWRTWVYSLVIHTMAPALRL